MNNQVRKQIIKMAKEDQKIRKGTGPFIKIDKKNTLQLKKIIQKYGWPDEGLAGKAGTRGAWLIVQHADNDIGFQERCLKLIKDKAKEKLVPLWQVAYLTDRVLVNKGKTQLYGTQFYNNRQGKLVSRPIKNKKNLEKRRTLFGLESFKKYSEKIKRAR